MNKNAAVFSLSHLLLEKATSRCTLSKRVSLAVATCFVILASTALWSSLSLVNVSTNSLYGLLAIFSAMMITAIVYTSFNFAKNSALDSRATEARSWHKTAYKLVACLAVVEHCVLFTAIAIVLYHALGLSITTCLSQVICSGTNYASWVTVSNRGSKTRTQELRSEPVKARFNSANMVVFAGLLASLGLSLVFTALYLYGEACRKTRPVDNKPRPGFSLYRRRIRMVRFMGACSLLQLIFGIVGISTVGNEWFSACIVLSVVSLYPVYRLYKGLTKDPTLTRFQFRKISQLSLTVIFISLYASGTGVYASLVSGIQISSEQMVSLISGKAMAQLVLLTVTHFVLSGVSFAAIYLHLSVTDVIESLRKTEESVKASSIELEQHITRTHTPHEDEVRTERMGSVIAWESSQCASCSTNQSNNVLVPCGHSVICSDCAKVLLTIPGFRCPVCCAEVIDAQTIPT